MICPIDYNPKRDMPDDELQAKLDVTLDVMTEQLDMMAEQILAMLPLFSPSIGPCADHGPLDFSLPSYRAADGPPCEPNIDTHKDRGRASTLSDEYEDWRGDVWPWYLRPLQWLAYQVLRWL